jgi:predicted metalloprotease
MKWEDYRQSDNVEDRRGNSGGGGGMFSSIGGGGRLGLGTIIVLGLIGYIFGIDPRILIGGAEMLNNGIGSKTEQNAPVSPTRTGRPSDEMGRFVSIVLAQTEDVWTKILPAQKGVPYSKPALVLFSGQTASSCGRAEAAMGPFYCPLDRKVYLDMSFFEDMRNRFGGGGDFAYAYVIAHEIGHHVQNLLGILPKVQAAQERASDQADANRLSVRVELMADCLAGVFAANGEQQFQMLEPGDVEKALATAQAIGDDRLQQAARGKVVPDSFTHGSSVQRQKWLMTGLKSGQVDSCNTFSE